VATALGGFSIAVGGVDPLAAPPLPSPHTLQSAWDRHEPANSPEPAISGYNGTASGSGGFTQWITPTGIGLL
jgi:hypothetical protein